MSKDVQLTFRCPHLTIDERAVLQGDYKTLLTSQPIAAFSSIKVLVNDQYYVPSSGYYSSAFLKNSTPGPYTILKHKNQLIIKNNNNTYTVNLNLGSRINTQEIVRQIKNVLKDEEIITIANNGFIEFSEITASGPNSKIYISGSAVESLFFTQRGSRGKLIFPGWNLIQNSKKEAYIKFSSVISGNPIIKVTYTTFPDICLRCQGSYVENDYRFNDKGDVILITEENLLYQSAMKIILTEKGSNPFHTFYGTDLNNYIGAKAISGIYSTIKEDVRRALNNLKEMQNNQSNYQVVSYKERLYQIASINVLQNTTDPTVFDLDIVIRNGSNQPINLTIIYTVPNVLALREQNGTISSINPETSGLSIPLLS